MVIGGGTAAGPDALAMDAVKTSAAALVKVLFIPFPHRKVGQRAEPR